MKRNPLENQKALRELNINPHRTDNKERNKLDKIKFSVRNVSKHRVSPVIRPAPIVRYEAHHGLISVTRPKPFFLRFFGFLNLKTWNVGLV